jgi:hypothetical protein
MACLFEFDVTPGNMEGLERDWSIQYLVTTKVHDAHPAPADSLLDLKLARDLSRDSSDGGSDIALAGQG